MRWAESQRQEWIAKTLREVGQINRRDLIKQFGISTPQASLDLRKFIRANPGAIKYDLKSKRYLHGEHIAELARVSAEERIKPKITAEAPKREKAVYIGAPACFALEQACQHINAAFGGYGCYVVGSSLDRADWRDVDVRMILSDDEFNKLFPDSGHDHHWESDPRWLLLTVSISAWLSKQTGLPIDFQFQPQTHANERHKGKRNPVGLRIAKSKATTP